MARARLTRRFWRWLGRRRWHQWLALGLAVVIVAVAVTIATVKIDPDEPLVTAGPRSEPDAAERAELAARFAPVVRLDSAERFVPIDVASYVSATTLNFRRGNGKLTRVDESPTLESLPEKEGQCQRAAGCVYVLDVRRAEPPDRRASEYRPISERLLTDGAQITVYSRVLRYEATGNYAVQYWFLYLFNHRLNEHESDWEQITIALGPDKEPKKALYSSHATGFVRKWEDVEQVDGHPVVYVSRGSHANYFRAGSHDVTISCPTIGGRRVCIGKRDINDISDGRGRELMPVRDYVVAELPRPKFLGSYGTGNYVAGRRANDVLSDPRTRPAWDNPLARLEKGKPL